MIDKLRLECEIDCTLRNLIERDILLLMSEVHQRMLFWEKMASQPFYPEVRERGSERAHLSNILLLHLQWLRDSHKTTMAQANGARRVWSLINSGEAVNWTILDGRQACRRRL